MMYVTYYMLQFLVPKYMTVCEKTSNSILKNQKLFYIQFIYFVYLSIIGKLWAYVAFIIYPLLIIFMGTLSNKLRKELIDKKIIHELNTSQFIKKTYVLNRIELLFGKTFLVMMVSVEILYIFSSILVTLGEDEMFIHAYFIFLLMIPFF